MGGMNKIEENRRYTNRSHDTDSTSRTLSVCHGKLGNFSEIV